MALEILAWDRHRNIYYYNINARFNVQLRPLNVYSNELRIKDTTEIYLQNINVNDVQHTMSVHTDIFIGICKNQSKRETTVNFMYMAFDMLVKTWSL